MISVCLTGGMANQLFQYAFGRSLQGHDVRYFDHCGQYGYQLGHFNTKISMLAGPEGPPHSEPVLTYDPAEKTPADPSSLYGYWQCEKYFLSIEDEIRAEVTLRETPSLKAQQCAEAISRETSAFLHIRRGDYCTWANEVHGVLPMDYYLRATRHIAERVSNLHFFAFSDDPEWVRQNLVLPYPITVINTTPHEDLWLMSKCSHAVIANSSFSWFGAWLGAGRAGVVVAPQQWFAKEKHEREKGIIYCNEDSRDIVPSRWTRL